MKVTYIKLFSADIWQSISEHTKRNALRWIAGCISDNLKLKHKPNLKFINIPPTVIGDDRFSELGKYSAQNNTIYLNVYFINDSYGVVETIAHELRHAWQRQISQTRDSKQSVIMANNIMNYVSFNDNNTYYNYQPMERDARRYAKEVRALVESISQEI